MSNDVNKKVNEYMEGWRTYAAAAIRGLSSDHDINGDVEGLCRQAEKIANRMMKIEKARDEQEFQNQAEEARPSNSR